MTSRRKRSGPAVEPPCHIDGILFLTYPPSQFTLEEQSMFPLAENAWNELIGRQVFSITPREESSGCDIRKDPALKAVNEVVTHLGRSSHSEGVIRIAPNIASTEEFRRILAHELGHMLGLQHVSDPAALMFQEPKTATPNGSDLAECRRIGLVT